MIRIDICKLRKSAGISQRQLADQLQVRQSFLSAIENGRSRLPEEKEQRLIDIFGHDMVEKFCIADEQAALAAPAAALNAGLSESDIVGQLLKHFHDLAHKSDSHTHQADSEQIDALRQRNDFLNQRNDKLSERIDELRDELDRLRREIYHLKELLITNGIRIS